MNYLYYRYLLYDFTNFSKIIFVNNLIDRKVINLNYFILSNVFSLSFNLTFNFIIIIFIHILYFHFKIY